VPASPFFPFHALGFRCNPFRVLSDEEWAEVAVLPGPIAALFDGGFTHLQVIGEAGRGKSTALVALAERFRQQGQRVHHEYLPEGTRRFRTPTDGIDLFCLDEAQRLLRGERRRLLGLAERGTRLVLSSHEDLAPLFARRRLPLTTVRLDDEPDVHFRAVLERRLDYFALAGAERVTFAPDALAALRRRFGTDLRAAERWLYELFQRLDSPRPLTLRDVE
jgi:hypothetical protein